MCDNDPDAEKTHAKEQVFNQTSHARKKATSNVNNIVKILLILFLAHILVFLEMTLSAVARNEWASSFLRSLVSVHKFCAERPELTVFFCSFFLRIYFIELFCVTLGRVSRHCPYINGKCTRM